MDRWLLGTLAASAVGFVVLGTWAEAAQLPRADLGDLGDRAGERVCVEGRLVQLRSPSTSSTRFVLTDGEHTALGWARFPWLATPGDLVEACGVVSPTGQGMEVQPGRPRDLTIVEPWDHEARPLTDLGAAPWNYLGQRVTTWGRVDRAGAAAWLVEPASGSRLPLVGMESPPPHAWARVDAWVEYDPVAARFELRVEAVEAGTEAPPWSS